MVLFFLCLPTVAGGKALASRGRYLLGRTDNVGNPKSKTNQQATAGMVPILHCPQGSCSKSTFKWYMIKCDRLSINHPFAAFC